MRIKRIQINGYKNLNNFEAKFTNEKTVIIGQNASGKSNFIEAIVLIFRNIELNENPEFDFIIHYTMNENKGEKEKKDIVIKGFKNIDVSKTKQYYSFWDLSQNKENKIFQTTDDEIDSLFENIVSKGNLTRSDIKTNRDSYFPKHIFVYYSGLGNSNRLEEILGTTDYNFAKALMDAEDGAEPQHRRIFNVQLHHSHYILLAFYGLDLDEKIEHFLKDNFKIENIESILFVLKQPYWKNTTKEGGDNKFWGGRGIVKDFLNALFSISTAPIREKRTQTIDMWREQKEERLFLYISNIDKIKAIVKRNGWNNIQFFNVLESIKASDLLRDIRVRIRKNYAGNITFKDLSEGEQQLLTVLGLMRFTRYEESLYLLDEPDTHLNPYWRWKYLDFVSDIADKPNTSQVIMTSHDPLTIGGLKKEEVRIFYTDSETGQIEVNPPIEDPKGMGVAGILTEIFGIPSTLDIATNEQLERRRHIESMIFNLEKNSIPLPENENLNSIKAELQDLNKELDNLGISRVTRDPMFQEFQAQFDKEMNYQKSLQRPLTLKEQEERDSLMEKIMKDIIAKQGI